MSMPGEEGVVISDVSSISLGEDGVITDVSCISIVVEDMVGPQVKEDREPVRRTRQQPELSGFLVDLAEMNIASGSNPMSTLVNRKLIENAYENFAEIQPVPQEQGLLAMAKPYPLQVRGKSSIVGKEAGQGFI